MATKTSTANKGARIAQSGSFEAGAGASNYLPIGLYSGYTYRALLGFNITSSWFSGMYQFVSAVFHYRTSTQHYVAFGSDPDFIIQKLTEDFSEGSSESLSTSNAVVWPGPSATSTNEETETPSENESTWGSKDISDMFETVLPSSVRKRDGNPGTGNGRFYGVRLRAVSEGSSADTTEIYSDDTSSEPYIVVTYTTNAPPNAPTLISPIGGVRVAGTTPNLVFDHNDPNGQALQSYDIQVSTDSTFASVTHWNLVNGTGSVSGNRVTRAYGGTALTRGTTYWWRARTKDSVGALGAWSAGQSFKANQLPSASKVRPTASQFAYIWNLAELAVWTSGGAHAKARLQWSFSDPDGGVQTAFRVRIYDAASAGNMVYDSTKLPGTQIWMDTSLAIVAGTERWWTIEVWDDADESSGESSRTAFKLRFGQAIYEHNAGSGSSAWQFLTGVIANGEVTTMFSSATGSAGTGRSAWKASIGELAVAAYLNVMVRMQPNAAPGTTPTLADMRFNYLGGASTPDRWVVLGASMVLDPSMRRYGTQSLKVLSTTGVMFLYPYRKTSGDDIPVQPNTEYTISAWVKTAAPLGGDLTFRIDNGGGGEVYFGGNTALFGPQAKTSDSSGWPEGWQRIWMTFTTPPGMTVLRPMLWYYGNGANGEVFWIDAVKLEEGTVATAWTPGFVGDPVILDANGIAVDASAGGIFRLRGSTGGSRDTLELGPHGLLFTDVELWSPNAEQLQLGDGLNQQRLIVEGPPSGLDGGQLQLNGAGAFADALMTNEQGVFSFGGDSKVVGDHLVADDLILGLGTNEVRLRRSANDILQLAAGDKLDLDGFADTALDTWTSYTPTLTNFGTVSSNVGWYQRLGGLVFFRVSITCSAAGAAAAVGVSLPVTAHTDTEFILAQHISGAANNGVGVGIINGGGGGGGLIDRIVIGTSNLQGNNLANTCQVRLQGWYRAA